MSALSSWHGWPTAAQAIVRSRSTQLLATASSTRPLMHAPAPSRRAAVACAPPSSSSRHYHATQAAEHDHIDMDEFEEPLSAAAREDLERALHPVWEELREQSHWQQEQEQGEQVYSGTEFGEEDGAEWKEWVRELQAEAMAQRPIPPPVPPPAPPPPVKIAATQSTTPMTDRPAATSTRPAPQALPPVEGLIRSRMDLTVSPIAPYRPPTPSSSKRKPRPDELPLLSRADWRLSSPIRRPPSTVRSRPPSLWKPEDTSRQGHNKLVGVGVDCSKVGIWNRQMETEEQWGWKVKVPKGEKGAWPAADVHRRR